MGPGRRPTGRAAACWHGPCKPPPAMTTRPLLLPALALAAGIWIAARLPVGGWEAGALAALCLALARWTAWRPAALAGWGLAGAAALALATPPAAGEHPLDALSAGQTVALRGTTAGPPRVQPDGAWSVPVTLTAPAAGTVVLHGAEGPPPPPAAPVAARAALTRPGTTHTPGQPPRAAAERRGGKGWRAHLRPSGCLLVARGSPGPVVRLRRAVRRFLTARLAPPVDGLALALVLGDRSRLSPPLREAFARTGTAHLLAISGLHVGIVALVAGAAVRGAVARWPALRRRLAPRTAGIVAGVAAAAGYGALTGWALSTRRAAAMAAALALALLLRRRVDPLQVVALAWIALLLATPAALFEPATALSFGSVVALLRLAPDPGIAPWRAAAAGSAAVALGTAPLSLAFFGQVPLGSVPVNLVAIPVLGAALVPTLLVACAAGLAWPAAGTALLAVGDVLARAGLAVVEAAADPRWCLVLPASPAPGLVALSLAAMGAALALPRRRQRWIGAVAAAALVLLPVHPGAPPRGELSLTALDVGHGDALLLAFPGGERWLIDAGVGGPAPHPGAPGDGFDAGARIVVPALRRMGVDHLDGAVITHLHRDHHGGMAAVLDAVDTDVLWLPELPPPDHPARASLDAARRRGTAVRLVDHGQAPPRRVGAVAVETLHPGPGRRCPRDATRCGTNDRSVVLRVTHGGHAVLLCGDAEAPLEAALAARPHAVRADVIKVPHHGSDTSSTTGFVAAVDPRLAIVSADPEEHRHFPRPSVRGRYRDAGAAVHVTGADGTVQVATDGAQLRVRCYEVGRGWSRWRAVGGATR